MKYETQRIAYWYFVCAMALFVGEHVVAPGYAVPPHLHEGEDEAFYAWRAS